MTAMLRPMPVAAAMLSMALGLAAGPATAHGLESSLERVADLTSTFALRSQFSTGVPAAGAAVSLVAPTGQTVALGHTDAQGQLRFRLPAAVDGSWEVRVDQGPGHRDYLELPGGAADGAAARTFHGLKRWSSPPSLAWGGVALVLVGALVRRPDRFRR
jgi:nickel transport protein